MQRWAMTLTTLSLASGCAVSPGNGTSHLLSINYSLLRRPALIYEQFEHRPPHRDRVEYFRWLHGAPIDPYDVTAMMSNPAARTEWEVGPDPSANPAQSRELLATPPGGHSMPMPVPQSGYSVPPSSSIVPQAVQPQPSVDVSQPATTPPVPDNSSWLQLFPDNAKSQPPTQQQPPSLPAPPAPQNPIQPQGQPLFPDTIPPLAPKQSPTDGNVTQAVHQTTRPVVPPQTNSAAQAASTPQPSRVSSRILFPSR
jgi:hypothetical protein